MYSERAPNSILVVSKAPKITELLKELFPSQPPGGLAAASSCAEGRRTLMNRHFDIIVINAPLGDEFGSELSLEVVKKTGAVAMLFVPRELYEQAADKLEASGVLVLRKPLTRETLSAVMRIACAMRQRIRLMERENRSLSAKMAEIRLVNRAKWMLIENEGMSEEQAHKYIEKLAMDCRVTKGGAAEQVMAKYGEESGK